MHALGHFKTITYHKLLVMKYCFRVGLIRQGLMHDMSKYSWTEFRIGAKYYTGTHSPNATEREKIGYSTAWLHHKGRNRHHIEYWIDFGGRDMKLVGHPMPTKYLVELCLDRIAACKVYHKKDYTDQDPLTYFNRGRDASMMHPETKRQVVEILTVLAEQGEPAMFRYIRKTVLRHPVKCFSNKPVVSKHPEEKDAVFLPGTEILHLSDQFKTPFYLYSEAKIRENCRAVFRAFSWSSGYRQFFPVKATPTPAILKILREEGMGVVCSSAAELELCERSGFLPSEIMFLPNDPREEDVDCAARLGCGVALDSPDLVDQFAEKGLLKGTVGLRINPGGIFRFGLSEANLDGMKFGMTPDMALETIQKLKSFGVSSVGLHAYLAGNILEKDYFPKLAAMLAELAEKVKTETGMKIAYLNLSGGLGIAYRPEDQALDLGAVADAVHTVLLEKLGNTEIPVYTELGRLVTGPAGILVTTVCHIKRGIRRFAGVDASASDLMRPMMYGAYHHVSVAGREGVAERENWDVVGAVCENTDKFAENRPLPPLAVGDVLVIHDAGAHGHSMGYQYGGRLRCGEYLLRDDGTAELIRRAETTEDYLATAIF